MIKIKKNESVVDIIAKVSNCKKKEIIVKIPFGHPILHNYLSLKILKNKAGKKEITIITSDLTSRKIGTNLGINYSIIKDIGFVKNQNILNHNYTFFEYLKYEIKYSLTKMLFFVKGDKKYSKIKHNNIKYKPSKIGIVIFLLGLTISILLFLFIFYFAVNKTYVYLKPEISVKTKSSNFIFREGDNESIIEDERVIKLKNISEKINLESSYRTSGINEDSIKKVEGKFTLYNKLNEEIELVKNTRLKNEDGIIYRLTKTTKIPKAKLDKNGKIVEGSITINAILDNYDIFGKLVGVNGNLQKDDILQIPGLSYLEERVYAKVNENIKSATNIKQTYLSQKDIDNSTKLFEAKIKKEAIEKIKEIMSKEYKEYEIFEVNGSIKYSDINIELSENYKVGDIINGFKIKGSLQIDTLIYNREIVASKMKGIVKNYVLDDIENVIKVDTNSIRISNIISESKNPYEVKATAQIEIFYSHNFLSENNSYTDKLKGDIIGLKKEEAIKVLLNNKKISDVEIDIRPFFIDYVSNIPNNIIFEVEE